MNMHAFPICIESYANLNHTTCKDSIVTFDMDHDTRLLVVCSLLLSVITQGQSLSEFKNSNSQCRQYVKCCRKGKCMRTPKYFMFFM